MDKELIVMPFVHRKSTKDSQASDIENSFSKQTRAWSKFNNRRNTSRIQNYFQFLHNKRITLSYNVTAAILCAIGIWIEALLINSYYTKSYQKQSESILDVFYSTLYQHVIHTLRDPTFFSDFFPHYFGSPYKYSLSAETAPIYAESFLIAYQFTSGYVTSWKAGDINGRLVELDIDEDMPNIAFLQYCDGINQPTYYWESMISHYNQSFPFEGGTEFSTENVVKMDWFISGYNASGPLISELYIKRTNNNFIPLYTLVFPSIDSSTHITDFVFSFDLTLIKVQQFLRTLNVSRNSRLAVTTNENILIAVTGDDQPIDTFNNEIVTKEISELADPVWSCVSKEEAFIRHENFSTRCTLTTYQNDDSDDVKNVTIAYTVFRGSVSIGKVTTWQFIAAVENTIDIESPMPEDIYQDKSPILNWNRDFIKPFIIGIVISAAGCFILSVIYWFTPYIIRIIDRKNKSHNKYEKIEKQPKGTFPLKKSHADFLSSFGWKYSNHTRPIGLLNVISELKGLQESSFDDEKVKLVAKKAVFEIRENSFGCPTFNETDFFSKIDNLMVREKMKRMFGNTSYSLYPEKSFLNKNKKNEDFDDFNLDDQEIIKRRRSSLSMQNASSFENVPVSLLSNSGFHHKLNSMSLNTYSKSSETSEKVDNELFQSNAQYLSEDEGDLIQQVVSIASDVNDYFIEIEFENVIQKVLNSIPNDQLFVVTNSFLFTDELIRMKSQLVTCLFDRDMLLSLFIAQFAFQMAMKEMRMKKENSKLNDRLFIKDDQIVFKCARSILYNLYEFREEVETSKKSNETEKEENNNENSENEVASLNAQSDQKKNNKEIDDSDSYSESEKNNELDLRWTKICEFTFEIVHCTCLSAHMEVITKSQLFLSSKLIETKLTRNESMILVKLLYVTSMVSFLFEKKNMNIGCSSLGIGQKRKVENKKDNESGNPDDDVAINDEDNKIDDDWNIMGCLLENLIYPEMIALNQIFESKYIRYSRKH